MNTQTQPDGSKLTWLGIAMIILGIIAIGSPMVAGSAVVIVIGIVLLIAGIGQVVQGLKADSWSDKAMPLILGIITTVAGLGVIGHPLLGLGFLTILLIVFFIIEGVWKIIASFSFRPAPGWTWMLVGGVVSLILGFLIWRQWPVSGLWAVGILVGVDMLMTGISMLTLGRAVKNLSSS